MSPPGLRWPEEERPARDQLTSIAGRMPSMSHNPRALQVAGGWLAVASVLLAITFIFHGPPEPRIADQMAVIAAGATRWLVVHWLAAVALSFVAVAGLLVLSARSRLTESGWTLSAWAMLPVGSLWTLITAVAEATAVTGAAIAGNEAIFSAWWAFSEGMANGFAALALCVVVIAGNEMWATERATPAWAAGIAGVAGIVSFVGWALWSWLDLGFAALIWVASSLLMCLWLLWLGVGLAWAAGASAADQRDVPTET